MAEELDRKLIPEFMQTAFAISLGATCKGIQMMKSPVESIQKLFSEANSLLTIPSDAGEGITDRTRAIASLWMEKGATVLEDCRTTGEKFTEGK